jgi:hypothetical protein
MTSDGIKSMCEFLMEIGFFHQGLAGRVMVMCRGLDEESFRANYLKVDLKVDSVLVGELNHHHIVVLPTQSRKLQTHLSPPTDAQFLLVDILVIEMQIHELKNLFVFNQPPEDESISII